jgi:hypothetical protein
LNAAETPDSKRNETPVEVRFVTTMTEPRDSQGSEQQQATAIPIRGNQQSSFIRLGASCIPIF